MDRFWITPLVALALCGCTKDEGGDTDTDVVDTDGDTDVVDTDTEEPFDGVELTVRAAVGADTSGLAASAFLIHIEESAGFGVVAEHEVAAASFDGASSVVLRVPTNPADIGSLFDGYSGAMYFVYVYEDADGNGTQGPTERIVGASSQVLLYVDEVSTDTDVAVVLEPDAWQALRITGPEEDPIEYDYALGFDVDAVLQRDAVTIGGTVDNAVETLPDLRATTLSAMDDTNLADPPFDIALGDPEWAVTVDAPLASHRTDLLDTSGDISLEAGIEVPFAYTDGDQSADFGGDPDDTLQAVACYDDVGVALFFVEDIVAPTDAVFAMVVGVRPGWTVTRLDPASSSFLNELPEEDWDALDLSSTCEFPQ